MDSKIMHWCSQCGRAQAESVSSCAAHGVVCCVCDCRVSAELAEDVGDHLDVSRGRMACPDCATEVIAEAHEEGDPCECRHCRDQRSKADARTRAAYVRAMGGLSEEGLRLLKKGGVL